MLSTTPHMTYQHSHGKRLHTMLKATGTSMEPCRKTVIDVLHQRLKHRRGVLLPEAEPPQPPARLHPGHQHELAEVLERVLVCTQPVAARWSLWAWALVSLLLGLGPFCKICRKLIKNRRVRRFGFGREGLAQSTDEQISHLGSN